MPGELISATRAESGIAADTVRAPASARAWRRPIGPKLVAGLTIVAVWWGGSVALPPDIVPAPANVIAAMAKLLASGDALVHLQATLGRILVGFAVSAVLGIALGLLMGLGRSVAQDLEAWITFIIAIPRLCWAIIALAWFALRNTAAVFTIVAITFPLIAVNFWSGVREVDMSLVEMARSLPSS